MNWNPLFPHIWDLIYIYIYIYKLPMKFTDRINGKKSNEKPTNIYIYIYISINAKRHACTRSF